MKHLSSTARQLTGLHARLKGEAKLDNILADIARFREQMQAKADATAVLQSSFDAHNKTASIATGTRGHSSSAIRAGAPDAVAGVARRDAGQAGSHHGQRQYVKPCPTDAVKQHFRAAKPNQLWVFDITYVSTCQGWLYLAF